MKKYFFRAFLFAVLLSTGCTGKNAEGKDSNGKDTLYQISDTSKIDSAGGDTIGKDAYQDSTSNAPRLPGGK
jgi:hypothetical protein